MPLRLIFMGTPEFAVPTLTEIVAAGHEVVAVYTRAPKPAGRGRPSGNRPGAPRGGGVRHSGADAENLREEDEQAAFARSRPMSASSSLMA